MSPVPSWPVISRISNKDLKDLSDKPEVVLFVYGLVLVPLALYVFHDIVDNRWRPTYNVVRYNIAYQILYIVAAIFLVGYIVLQWIGSDFKEVGAGLVALILATYRAWTLLRLTAILNAHRRIVAVLKKCNSRLKELSVERTQFQQIEYFLIRKPPRDTYERHLYISESLFDDSYPGHSARIKWLTGHARVHKNDMNECASRIAVWMRVVMGNTNMRIWDGVTGSNLGIFEKGNRGKLYETLLSEFMGKPTGKAPAGVSKNPGEQLINLQDRFSDNELRELGAGIFWFARRVRDEEFGHTIAAMPAHWLHETASTGKEMMLEMGTILMLSVIKIPECSTGKLIQLTSEDLSKWLLKENGEIIWNLITDVCENAVAGMILQGQNETETAEDSEVQLTHSSISNVIKKGVNMMRDQFRRAGGTSRPLCYILISMIRRAYFGGYIVESVWREHIDHICVRAPCDHSSQLYLAEIAFSLYHVLATLDFCDRNRFNEDTFEKEKKELSSLGCDGRGVQDCPANTFRVFIKVARSAAREVHDSLFTAVLDPLGGDQEEPVLNPIQKAKTFPIFEKDANDRQGDTRRQASV